MVFVRMRKQESGDLGGDLSGGDLSDLVVI